MPVTSGSIFCPPSEKTAIHPPPVAYNMWDDKWIGTAGRHRLSELYITKQQEERHLPACIRHQHCGWCLFCIKKEQKKNSRLERLPWRHPQESFRSCFLPSAQSPFLWRLRWRQASKTFRQGTFRKTPYFPALFLYYILICTATQPSADHRKRDYCGEDAYIPPRASLSCSSLLFSSFAVIFLISPSYLM